MVDAGGTGGQAGLRDVATALFLFGIAGVTRRIELKRRMTWAAYGVSLIAIVYIVVG